MRLANLNQAKLNLV
jgi:uncharacterized protein YjbI with pentapeptide repeats